METILRMSGDQHKRLREHLYPGDGCEAVAVALCGRFEGSDTQALVVREIKLIPYEECSVRTPYRVSWSTDSLVDLLTKAARYSGSILKIHSHPGGFSEFSATDDEADRELFESIHGWVEGDGPHASCVMLPDGTLLGRSINSDGDFVPLEKISVAGDDLRFWHSETGSSDMGPEFARRHVQAFGAGTFHTLRRLSVAVVGCSGTGSPVIEMLARLGIGRLVMVDPDTVETKNLNRILNATGGDARRESLKVEVLARAVQKMETGTQTTAIAKNLFDPDVVRAVAECDVLFGCMDSVDGRHLLNKIAVFYSVPYFDLGVKLVADGRGGVEQICGTVHYLQPDGSSLMSRGTYTQEHLAAAALKRANPAEYAKQTKEKYIIGVQEERPAVISVNMLIASLGVNEMLARLHVFRDEPNAEFATTRISLTQPNTYYETDGEPCPVISRHIGRGDVVPLLDLPELSESAQANRATKELVV